MRIVKSKTLSGYWITYRDAMEPLKDWLKAAKDAEWKCLVDIRQNYPSADIVESNAGRKLTVFNIKGGKYRLIVATHFNTQTIFIRDFMTHADYSKNQWKDHH